MNVLKASTHEGIFFCYTDEPIVADDFINSQRTLLRFFRDCGLEVRKLGYFATNYDDSFSDSSNDSAYIALSSMKTYQQVLVTLQALWGDYVDYGYVYAVSNAIANELGWKSDIHTFVEDRDLDKFFVSNPDALNMQYPSFTTMFASEETVENCKKLSISLLESIDLFSAINKPIDIQLDEFCVLVSNYAERIGVSFSRGNFGARDALIRREPMTITKDMIFFAT